MALSFHDPCCQSVVDDDDCSSDHNVIDPRKQVLNYMGHSAVSSKTLGRDLQDIAKGFDEYGDLKEDFMDAYPYWECYRKKSIAGFTDIINDLDSIHRNVNIAKTTAVVGELCSSFVGIAGAVAGFNGHSCTSSLLLASSIGGLVSSATSSGATVTEVGLAEKYTNKARRLLREDLERFEPMQMWFKHSQDLKLTIERVCNYNVMLDVFQKLVVTVPQAKHFCDTFSPFINEVTEEVVTMLINKNMSPNDIEKIVLLCVSAFRHPEFFGSVKKIYQLMKDVPSIIPMVSMFYKVPCEVKVILNYIFDSNGKLSANKVSKREATSYGIFQAFNVGLQLISLFALVDSFQKGCTSEHSAEIKELRDQLKLQLDLVSAMYQKVKNDK